MFSVCSIFPEPTTHSLVLIRSKVVDIYGKFHDLLCTLFLFSDTLVVGQSQALVQAAPDCIVFVWLVKCMHVCVCVCKLAFTISVHLTRYSRRESL